MLLAKEKGGSYKQIDIYDFTFTLSVKGHYCPTHARAGRGGALAGAQLFGARFSPMESQSPQWRDHALAVEEGGLNFSSSCYKKQRSD